MLVSMDIAVMTEWTPDFTTAQRVLAFVLLTSGAHLKNREISFLLMNCQGSVRQTFTMLVVALTLVQKETVEQGHQH